MDKEFSAFGLDYLITGTTDGTVGLWAIEISGRIVVAKLISSFGML